MKIEYGPKIPEAILGRLKRAVKEASSMLPNWCSTLYVVFETDTPEPGTVCNVRVRQDYRWAKITVFPYWLKCDFDEQVRYLKHETIHVLVAPMADILETFAKEYMREDTPSNRMIKEQFRVAMEQTVQDITEKL